MFTEDQLWYVGAVFDHRIDRLIPRWAVHHSEVLSPSFGAAHLIDHMGTHSPCSMCTGAVLLYKIPRVVIGENKTFVGGEELLKEHGVEVKVVDDAECKELLARFITERPEVGR